MAFTVNNVKVAAPATPSKKKVELATGGQIRCVIAMIKDKTITLPFNETFKGLNGKDYTLEINKDIDAVVYAPKFLLSLLIDKYSKNFGSK